MGIQDFSRPVMPVCFSFIHRVFFTWALRSSALLFFLSLQPGILYTETLEIFNLSSTPSLFVQFVFPSKLTFPVFIVKKLFSFTCTQQSALDFSPRRDLTVRPAFDFTLYR